MKMEKIWTRFLIWWHEGEIAGIHYEMTAGRLDAEGAIWTYNYHMAIIDKLKKKL